MLISILITTRDRPEKLKETLEAIAALDVPPDFDYEVLVVDNGSKTDGTKTVCREMESALGKKLRFSEFPQAGKSRAANAGFKMLQGEIIAFLDDDILPQKDWLAVIVREFSSDATLAGISGRVELRDPQDLQFGVRRLTERAKLSKPMDACYLFIGCNFAVRRALIENHGLYDPLLGPGSRIGSAEDLDFCYRAWKAGEQFVYEPSLFVLHAHGRRDEKQGFAIRKSYMVGRGAFYGKYVLKGDSRIAREMYWNIRAEFRDLFRARRSGESLRHLGWLAKGFAGYVYTKLAG